MDGIGDAEIEGIGDAEIDAVGDAEIEGIGDTEIDAIGDTETDGDALRTQVRGGSASENKFTIGRRNGMNRSPQTDRFFPNLNVSPHVTLLIIALFVSE
jgi:hypothetical protein